MDRQANEQVNCCKNKNCQETINRGHTKQRWRESFGLIPDTTVAHPYQSHMMAKISHTEALLIQLRSATA